MFAVVKLVGFYCWCCVS